MGVCRVKSRDCGLAPLDLPEYLHISWPLIKPNSYMPNSGIETVPIKPGDILRMIKSEEIQDSKSVAGLLYYLEYSKVLT
jgi:hypothetical protein